MRIKARMPEERKRRVRELRRNITDAEELLWERLRDRRFMNAKFRRQHPVQGYVLDFYCHEAKLGVELDGSEHNKVERSLYDIERSRIVSEQQGVTIIRFWNSEVLNHTEEVLHRLGNILTSRLSLETSIRSPDGRRAGDEGQKENEWK